MDIQNEIVEHTSENTEFDDMSESELDNVIVETEEELYNAEYDKAWSDEEEVEQSPEETDTDVDVQVEDENVENSIEKEEGSENTEESNKEDSEKEFVETLKWKGKEIPVTAEERLMLAQKGFDSEKKWQDVASIRPYHSLIEDNGLTVEQVQTLVDIVKSKNPEALALLAEQAGIDMFEAERKTYAPSVEEKDYELEDVIAEINQDEAIATQMNDYVSSVPQAVKNALVSQPAVLRELNEHMKHGVAQVVMPEVIKQLAINPNQDFVQLYKGINEQRMSSQQAKAPEVKPTKPLATSEEKKRVAVSNKTSAPKKSITDDYDAAWEDDEAFNRVRARLSGF